MKTLQLFVKRFADVFFSILLLTLLSPLFAVFSSLIKSEDKGKIFFLQERLGKNGKVFKIIKFRTMVEGAQKKGKGIHVSESDDRITKVGSFLRKTSLDEIPQLINILRGNMSFIGPRPPLTFFPKEYIDYSEKEKIRFRMKPGMTGLAQINGRNEIDWFKRFEFDIIYVENWSLLKDLKILFGTFFYILRKKGVYSSGK